MEKKYIVKIESTILLLVFFTTVVGVWWAYVDKNSFKYTFAKEDGVVEWLTVIGLLSMFFICIFRIISLRTCKSSRFLLYTALFAFLFLFAAGEEISWGQRIFDFETPELMKKYNAQKEFNFHNLVFNGIKINKLVFGKILAVIIIVYLGILSFLYFKEKSVKEFINDRAIPIPRTIHILSFLSLFLLTQLIPSGKKGELLEFGGVFIFLCILVHPYNYIIFEIGENKTA